MAQSSIGSSIASGLSSLAGLGAALSSAAVSGYTLKLGDFIFQDLEIPEMLSLGGEQQTVVHQLIGGARIIDQLGAAEHDYAFRGLLFGANALARASALTNMRKSGGQYVLTFASLRYTVAIRSITFDLYAFNRLGYEIVLTDLPQAGTVAGLDANASIAADLSSATGYATAIGDSGISGGVSSISSAMAGITNFASATKAHIQSVLTPIATTQGLVKNLTATLNNDIHNLTTLGGIAPNNPIAKSASGLLSTVNQLNQLSSSYGLTSTLNNMSKTLGSVSSMGNTARTVTTVGGDLLSLAQQHYGDATQWPKIAAANNLTDPKLTGTNTLVIPQ